MFEVLVRLVAKLSRQENSKSYLTSHSWS